MSETEEELRQSRERLEAAKILFQNEKHEDAVNRGYYSMFHSSKALLKTREKSPKTHKGLIREFGKTFVKSGEVPKRYAVMLSKAESLREDSDYGLDSEVGAEEAGDLIRDSEDFLAMVRERIENK